MGTFAQIAKGTRARRKGVKFPDLCGGEHVVDLRILNGKDDEEHIARAGAIARAAGARAEDGDLAFDYARACEVVAAACIDPDSPEDVPKPYFASVAEVKEALDRERIFLLQEEQLAYQESVSPRQRKMEPEEFIQHVFKMAHAGEQDELPFVRWAPSLRLSFARTLAKMCIASLQHKSLSSSDSGVADETDTATSPPSSSRPESSRSRDIAP